MLSDDLSKLLAPFRFITSRSAAAPAYRSIELTPERVKACASYGLLETHANVGVNERVWVDATAFLSVVTSLPRSQEVKLKVQNGALAWSAGPAKGTLATISPTEMPEAPAAGSGRKMPASKAIAHVLECGAISCDNAALGSIGIYGVVLNNDKTLKTGSTDNVTISSAEHAQPLLGAPRLMTLPPPGAELLAAVMDKGQLQFEEKSVVYRSDKITCYVRQVPPIKTNLDDVLTQYADEYSVAKIPADRIAAFIKRANALTASKQHTRVLLGAAHGQITLGFAEGTASSEEYILAENIDTGGTIVEPVALPASKVARAMGHIDEVVIDHCWRGVIIFRGGSFRYLVSGVASGDS